MLTDQSSSPEWHVWSQRLTAALWEAVALSCNIDPKSLIPNGRFFPDDPFNRRPREFTRRMTIARDHISHGRIKTLELLYPEDLRKVSLRQFRQWAEENEWELPDQFPRDKGILPPKDRLWPWGTYETEGLRMLDEAVKRFYSASVYDPANPGSAPTNEQVEEWLIKKGVSRRKAEVIATLIRPDGLPTGPR